MKMFLIFLFFTCAVSLIYAQDCKTNGKRCADHEQCCGGCCFDGECVDTYRSCLSGTDVCREHVCVGEENCVAFVPPECPGCEPLPLCQIIR